MYGCVVLIINSALMLLIALDIRYLVLTIKLSAMNVTLRSASSLFALCGLYMYTLILHTSLLLASAFGSG